LGETANYIKMMAQIDPNEPLYGSLSGPGAALLKEAEKAYTAGDFTTAMAKYTAAADADPKLYDAPSTQVTLLIARRISRQPPPGLQKPSRLIPIAKQPIATGATRFFVTEAIPLQQKKNFSTPWLPNRTASWHGKALSSGRRLKKPCCWHQRLIGRRSNSRCQKS